MIDYLRFTLAFPRHEYPAFYEYMRQEEDARRNGDEGARGRAKDFICRLAEAELTKAENPLLQIETQLAEIREMLKNGVALNAGTPQQQGLRENQKLSEALSKLGF